MGQARLRGEDATGNHPGPGWRGRWVGRLKGQWPPSPSGWEWNGLQLGQGAAELGFPGPAPGEMQIEAPRLAGDAGGPAGQIVGHDLDRQPGGVGGKASRGEMVEPHAVLQVAYGVLDLGVATMVGFQPQGFPVPVGDEVMIPVAGEEGQLGRFRLLMADFCSPTTLGWKVGNYPQVEGAR